MTGLTFANEMCLKDAIERYIQGSPEDAQEGFVTDTFSNVVKTLQNPLHVISRGIRTTFGTRPGYINCNLIEKCITDKKPFDWYAISDLTIPMHVHQSKYGEQVAQQLWLDSADAEDIALWLKDNVNFYRGVAREPECLGNRVPIQFPQLDGFDLNKSTEGYHECFKTTTNRSGTTTVGVMYERLGEVYNAVEHTNRAVARVFDKTNPKTVEKHAKELNRILYGLIRVAKDTASPAMKKAMSEHVSYLARCIEFYGVITATIVAQQKIMQKTVDVIEEQL